MADQRTTTRRLLAKGLAVAPALLGLGAAASRSANASPSPDEIAAWTDLLRRYEEAQGEHDRAVDTYGAREKESWALSDDGPPATIEAAEIAKAHANHAASLASSREDALALEILATPAPHIDAFKFKLDLWSGEDREYFSYEAVDSWDVLTEEAIFFAGAGPRPSRSVLEQFKRDLPEWIASHVAKDDEHLSEALKKAETSRRHAEAVAKKAVAAREAEARLGSWLDDVDAGGGVIYADQPKGCGVTVVFASVSGVAPTWYLKTKRLRKIAVAQKCALARLDEIRAGGPLPAMVADMRKWTTYYDVDAAHFVHRREISAPACADAEAHGRLRTAL